MRFEFEMRNIHKNHRKQTFFYLEITIFHVFEQNLLAFYNGLFRAQQFHPSSLTRTLPSPLKKFLI